MQINSSEKFRLVWQFKGKQIIPRPRRSSDTGNITNDLDIISFIELDLKNVSAF